jgi:hypothetical protein
MVNPTRQWNERMKEGHTPGRRGSERGRGEQGWRRGEKRGRRSEDRESEGEWMFAAPRVHESER